GVFHVEPKSTTGDRVLVLLDKEDDKALYSKFFNSLEEREYKLTYKLPTDSNVELFSYGERAYDHVINFAPKTKNYKDKVNPLSLLNFVNNGGNILLGASSELSETIRDFAREFDIDFDDLDTSVIDHFNYDKSDDGKHTLIIAKGITNNEAILTKNVIEGPPVLFRGIAHKVGTVPLLTKILWAGETAYSYETKADQQVDQEPLVVGSKAMLVSALQARNNARITFVGSTELFSDRFFDSPIQKTNSAESFTKSGNEDFVKDLTKWTFQEKGVLKVTSRNHHKENETEELEVYRIKDNIVYTIEISEYANDHWQAFNGTDVQFEAIMLDPYIRKTLTPLPILPEQQARKYKAHIQLPDVYGVFTFKVNYKRSGYSYIEDSSVVAIRPFRHNEYPRYISAAYPYYTGAASMIVGFLLFSVIWFFNKENSKRVKKKMS
ncbi:14908_t:CDS:2, partial [Dentiscutata heterogama]